MNNAIALSTTGFFNDRGCHIRIEHIMRRLNITRLMAYNAGRERSGINIMRINTPRFMNRDYIGFHFMKILLDICILRMLIAYIKKERPGHILAFTHEAGILAMIARAMTHTPFILDYQGSLSGEMKSYASFARLKPFRCFITIIEHMVEDKAIAVLYNTAFSYNASPRENKFLIRDHYNPPESRSIATFREGNEKIILWLGPLTKRQGLSSLIYLLDNTIEHAHRLKFVIVGHSGKTDPIKRQYPHALFTGKINFEYIPSVISDADICISTKEESREGSHKLYMYKQYCSDIVALRSKAACEMLSESEIADSIEDMLNMIMEKI